MYEQAYARWYTKCIAYKCVHQLYPTEFPSAPVHIQRIYYAPETSSLHYKIPLDIFERPEEVIHWSENLIHRNFCWYLEYITNALFPIEWDIEITTQVIHRAISRGVNLNDAYYYSDEMSPINPIVSVYGEVISMIAEMENTTVFLLLHNAVQWANYGIVKLLLELGADPNLRDTDGYNALEYTLSSKYSMDNSDIETKKKIIVSLIKHGAILPTSKQKHSKNLGPAEFAEYHIREYPFPELLD